MSIRKIKQNYSQFLNQIIQLKGWVSSNRGGKKVSFLVIQDGSGLASLQVVYRNEVNNNFSYREMQKLPIGSAISVKGKIVNAKNKQEIVELNLIEIQVINKTKESYFLQKKEHTKEFMRSHSELRARSRYYLSIFRIRNELIKLIHEYLQNQEYHYLHSPILTNNDCEGGGETFNVSTNEKNNFFKTNAVLTVSGQLQAEAFAQCLRKVYTFAPTFRADKSNTRFHTSEFWMLEPEIAFAKMEDGLLIVESLIKTVLTKIKKTMKTELEYLTQINKIDLIERIKKINENKFACLTYDEIITKLQKNKNKFKENNIHWGMDLQKEHEHFICEEFKKPVFIINYPEKIKAFYMKLNEDGKTVRGFDLLVPEIGELVGGSERENDYEKLKIASEKRKLNSSKLDWYLNLRKQGYGGSTGFGLGFDRLLLYITGVKNIRDVIPFFVGFNSLHY